jgi:hypothetical protein
MFFRSPANALFARRVPCVASSTGACRAEPVIVLVEVCGPPCQAQPQEEEEGD